MQKINVNQMNLGFRLSVYKLRKEGLSFNEIARKISTDEKPVSPQFCQATWHKVKDSSEEELTGLKDGIDNT